MHGGLEAREVQGEARVVAVQLLRRADKLLLEGLWRAREADTGGAHLAAPAPCLDVRATFFSLAFSTRRRAPYAASWRSCHQAWTESAIADLTTASSS